jgi:SAM-dependent methyltransferase
MHNQASRSAVVSTTALKSAEFTCTKQSNRYGGKSRPANSAVADVGHSLQQRTPWWRELFRTLYRMSAPLAPPPIVRTLGAYLCYFYQLYKYRRMPGAETICFFDLYPCLRDRKPTTPIDLNYFLQDTWAAGKVFQRRPAYHVDIGSTALLVGILSQFTRVCSIDIRPLPVNLPGLEVRQGSIVDLPFDDCSLESISSLCVIEHIGLGRYGDPLDPSGTRRAAAELQRVLAHGGHLYISVPIHPQPRVYFNAHRVFRHEDVLAMFANLTPVEVTFIQWGNRYSLNDYHRICYAEREVVGLYDFCKSSQE